MPAVRRVYTVKRDGSLPARSAPALRAERPFLTMVAGRCAAYHARRQMLRRLRIENLVLIHEAELALRARAERDHRRDRRRQDDPRAGDRAAARREGRCRLHRPRRRAEAYVEAELDLPPALLDEEELSLAGGAPAAGRGRSRPGASRLRGRAHACVCLGPRAAAREDHRRGRRAADRDVGAVRAAPPRHARRTSSECSTPSSARSNCAAARKHARRGASSAAARKRHEELQAGADAEVARLAGLRALVEDTAGMEPGDGAGLPRRARASASRHRARAGRRCRRRGARSRRRRRCRGTGRRRPSERVAPLERTRARARARGRRAARRRARGFARRRASCAAS